MRSSDKPLPVSLPRISRFGRHRVPSCRSGRRGLLALLALTAVFFLVPVTQAVAAIVHVDLAGSGTGTVTSNPAGINCSGNGGSTTGECSHEFGIFEAVDLTATGNTGSQLTGWLGNGGEGSTCDTGDENPCHFVNRFEAVTITADFASVGPQQTLKVKLVGSGSGEVTSAPAGIECGATCEAPFGEGSTVILTATHNARSTFAAWRGCDSISAEGKCEVTMSAAKSVEAEFDAIPQQTLEVHKTGPGSGEVTSSPTGIECGATCTAEFNEGSTVILTAAPGPPAPGSRNTFAAWRGCDSISAEGKCEVTMSEAKSVEAEFDAIPQHTLKVQLAGSGSGEVTSSPAGIECGSACEAEFEEGSAVTLTATHALGSVFAGWSGGGCSGTGSCEVTLTAATSVTASFEPLPPPTAATGEATEITQTTAMIAGTINGQGADTHWLFSYGADASYGSKAPENGADAGVVSADTGVSVELTGLEPNTTYHYELSACNVFFLASGGGLICSPTSNLAAGLDRTLTTLPLVPGVNTDVPVIVGADTATVGGGIVAQGADTKYQVEYGTSDAFGSSTPQADAGSATTGRYVTVNLEGLQPDTSYDYRFVAHNSGGKEEGKTATLTTNASGEPSSGSLPGGFSLTGPPLAGPAPFVFPDLAGLSPLPPPPAKTTTTPKALTNAQKLAKAVKTCKKDKSKAKRVKCEKQARKKYEPVKKK
jgi:hypothetical protein